MTKTMPMFHVKHRLLSFYLAVFQALSHFGLHIYVKRFRILIDEVWLLIIIVYQYIVSVGEYLAKFVIHIGYVI